MAETAQAATPEEVAAAYFKAWKAGDIDRVRPLLHPDVNFLGAMGALGLDRLVCFPTRWDPTPEAQGAFAQDCKAAGITLAAS